MKRYPSLAIAMLLFGCGAVANAQTLPSGWQSRANASV